MNQMNQLSLSLIFCLAMGLAGFALAADTAKRFILTGEPNWKKVLFA